LLQNEFSIKASFPVKTFGSEEDIMDIYDQRSQWNHIINESKFGKKLQKVINVCQMLLKETNSLRDLAVKASYHNAFCENNMPASNRNIVTIMLQEVSDFWQDFKQFKTRAKITSKEDLEVAEKEFHQKLQACQDFAMKRSMALLKSSIAPKDFLARKITSMY